MQGSAPPSSLAFRAQIGNRFLQAESLAESARILTTCLATRAEGVETSSLAAAREHSKNPAKLSTPASPRACGASREATKLNFPFRTSMRTEESPRIPPLKRTPPAWSAAETRQATYSLGYSHKSPDN